MRSSWGSTLFTEVTRTCKRVMSQSQRSTTPLVATNKAVVEDLELNFGDDNPCELVEHTKTFDAVLFDILRISPEDIANQLTLIDLPLFQDISPDELTSCEWTGKKKFELCPHVVRFIKRFNQVSFWVTTEILNSNTPKTRADKVTHFIRIAKKLLDLSNLNSLKAVVSSLHSAPIHRLTKTWNLVPKREKDKLDKLHDTVSEDSNNRVLRNYLEGIKLPCIPYLGMYLTDLTYINTIHPCTGGLDTERTEKMNEICRIISDFQHSEYDNLEGIAYIQNYLTQLKYIDELQKFVEDDNYKLSLRIEPNMRTFDRPTKESSSTTEFASESEELLFPPSFRKSTPSKRDSGNPRPSARLTPKTSSLNLPGPFRSPSPDKKHYAPSHRKVKSLGSHQQFVQTMNPQGSGSSSLSSSSAGSRYNLVDDSVVDDTEVTGSNSYDSGLDQDEPETHPIILNTERPSSGVLTPSMPSEYLKLEGFLKRKTVLKNGSRPNVASWRRFWVGLMSSTGHLVYFLPKHPGFGGHDRKNFRSDPHKVVPLVGCTVFVCSEKDSFKLTEESGHTVYHFRAGSQHNANVWYEALKEAAEGGKSRVPANLIDFGEEDDRTVVRDTHL